MTTTTMRAFHNDPAIKAHYLAQVQAHAQADEIVKGFYWDRGKGCAVGCTIHGEDHQRYETVLGIPQTLARLEDTIFEGLPNVEGKEFPLAFLTAIPVGADLSRVSDQFLAWLLKTETLPRMRPEDRPVGEAVLHLFERQIAGEAVTADEWRAAADSAGYAARSAWSAAHSAGSAADSAGYAARSAGYAAHSAGYAAHSAGYAAHSAGSAAHSAGSAVYQRARDALLSLLAAAPVPGGDA